MFPLPVLEQFYALLSVCSSGSQYKSSGMLLKVVIEHEVEALALLFALGKWEMFNQSLLRTGRNKIQLRFWSDSSCNKIATTGLL